MFRRSRLSLRLPSPDLGLQAAGVGRFVLTTSHLLLDAIGQQLLDASSPLVALAVWKASLPPSEASAVTQALRAGKGRAAPFALVLQREGRSILLRGSLRAGSIQGVLVDVTPARDKQESTPLLGRDEFVASISHELRTPLNAILGFGRLARADWPRGVDRRHLDHIELASRLMLRVVNDLLDLTRLKAGKLDIRPEQPLSVHAVLTQVAAMASSLRQGKAIKLYASVDARCPHHLRGDVGRIEQILLNLVANALKFTERGSIVIDARLRAMRDDSVVLRFSVSDTGVGMPAEQVERIGIPFGQLADPSLPPLEGAGLGLAVVTQLLALQQAQLRVVSVPGGGSIFWFDIEWSRDRSRAEPSLSLNTAVFSQDERLQQTVATQWRVHGQAVLLDDSAASAARWVVDLNHPQAKDLIAQGRAQGRDVFPVTADPVEEGSGFDTLPLLSQRVFQHWQDESLPVDPLMQGLKVLVVEDNMLNQHVMREFLHRLGADVVILGEGYLAPELVGKRHFDVMLLDIQMPGMNGWQVAQAVRAQPNGAKLPIIFLSAQIDERDQQAAAKLGALACMSKPFDVDVLHQLMRQLASKSGTQNESQAAAPVYLQPAAQSKPSLVQLFETQWPDMRLALRQAKDNTSLRQAVHALRGSLAVLRVPELVARTRELENRLLAGDQAKPDDVAALIAQVDQFLCD